MMIARASRVLPGVLVTMLLAVPAHAAASPDTTTGVRAGHARHSQEHKTAAVASATRIKSATKVIRATANAVRRRSNASSAPPQASASAEPRKTGHTTAFIDDGFAYAEAAPGKPGWKQSGVASWYGGSRWQGHLTSSGARYDENQLTAAHATLPLGSKVHVKLHNSERDVVVTITDRPGTRTRIIDLSRGAAKALGILSQGVAMVTLSPL